MCESAQQPCWRVAFCPAKLVQPRVTLGYSHVCTPGGSRSLRHMSAGDPILRLVPGMVHHVAMRTVPGAQDGYLMTPNWTTYGCPDLDFLEL